MTSASQRGAPIWSRRALLVPALAILVAAVAGGLERMGVWPLMLPSTLVALHGPLMVCGFFGVVISLERAVAVGGRWPLLGPAFALAAVVLLFAGRLAAGTALFLAASLLLLALCVVVVRRQAALFTVVMTVGAAAWVIGNAVWLTERSTTAAVWWWVAFLVVTIAAERLELSRLVRRPRHAEPSFAIVILVLLGSLAASELRLVGASLLALALWLTLYDVAKRTVRKTGLARYAAYALLSGFFWLAVSGALLVVRPATSLGAGLWYDAALHSALVGFVLAMVFAHAPLILPAVARFDVRYERALYAPLALLHASLFARVVGDLIGSDALRHAGAIGNALTLAAFAAVALSGVARRRWRARAMRLSPTEVQA